MAANVDDAATVLEQFCLDVNNLPAEIAHLLEEITAKDSEIVHCREAITDKDNIIQKHVRANPTLLKHPKEDAFTKIILSNYDRMQALQNDKVGLSSKALVVLERQVKRLDVKIRNLQLSDQFPQDPTLPSLLNPSSALTGLTFSADGTPPPLTPLTSAQIAGAPNMANAAMARATGLHIAPTGSIAGALVGTPRSSRDNSTEASKRRRLNPALSISATAQNSTLGRQGSIGPATGTPKTGTPVPTTATGVVPGRTGSAQPSRPTASRKSIGNKKVADGNAARKRPRASISLANGNLKKGDRRRQLARDRLSGSPSPSQASVSPDRHRGFDGAADHGSVIHDSDDSGVDSDKGSISSKRAAAVLDISELHGHHATLGTGFSMGDEEDKTLYCFCQRFSAGAMVGCDNDDCRLQWFHWECVGITAEPEGDWFCPECRKLPPSMIKRSA